MRKSLSMILGAASVALLWSMSASAAPVDSVGVLKALEASSLVQDVRVYCYNRSTGRFLHWGHCRRQVRHYYYRPRVYCYNRRTGRFLHWGHC